MTRTHNGKVFELVRGIDTKWGAFVGWEHCDESGKAIEGEHIALKGAAQSVPMPEQVALNEAWKRVRMAGIYRKEI